MKTIVELDNLSFNHRNTTVYYSNPDIVVQAATPFVQVEKANGELILLNDLIFRELNIVKSCRYKDQVLLIGGDDAALIDFDGCHEHFKINHRYVITELYVKDNIVAFGSILGKFFHFVVYDLEQRKRIYQSQSISARTLSYHFTDDYIYALMGNSQLMCYDYECKEVWKKFEPHYVIPGIAEINDKMVYSANNQIKITDGKTTDTINVPLVTLNKIEGIIGNNVYGVCEEKKNICCFDIKRDNLVYEIKGDPNADIRQLLLTKGRLVGKDTISNVLFFSTDSHLNLIDIDKGSVSFHIGISKIKDISHNDEIIVSTHTGESHLLRAKAKNVDTVIEV